MDKLKQTSGKGTYSYKERLNSIERLRYEDKIKLIGGTDPYEVKDNELSKDVSFLPGVANMDIIQYLIFTPSPYTKEELKNYKSLDAYNQFICGWVSGVCARIQEGKVLVKAKVSKLCQEF